MAKPPKKLEPPVRPWAWWALGASLLALGGGWLLGWSELAAPGGAVAAVFVAGAVSSIGNPKFAVALTARHRRVAEGADPGVVAQVTNSGARRVGARRLVLPVGPGTVGVKLPALAPGASVVTAVPVPTKRRAVLTVGPAQAVRGDPLGMVARTWSWGTPLDVVVYPRTIRVPVGMSGMAKDIEGKPTGQPSETDVSFHALRDYEPGDDRRSIHWRSSARLGRLMVRQSEDARRVQMAVLVSTAAREYSHPRDFELAVSAYASLGLAQLAASGELAVIARGALLPIAKAGPGPLLDHAAAIQLADDPSGAHSLAAAAGAARGEAPGATLAALVTGTVLTDRDLRRIAWFLPREASALAIRCRLGADITVSRIGRLGLATIGALEHLPRALRRLGLQ
ncbi:MAG: DUF58 domain-containing protein [Bifidobacteriaceae bacterium]|jgi:uncharacterized protein (DUF58 family)|nr:DUF58 domain-containing protein [Bifidobacteriaceae bacterium]